MGERRCLTFSVYPAYSHFDSGGPQNARPCPPIPCCRRPCTFEEWNGPLLLYFVYSLLQHGHVKFPRKWNNREVCGYACVRLWQKNRWQGYLAKMIESIDNGKTGEKKVGTLNLEDLRLQIVP
uniref:Uncharacterized protein LOC110202664 isoform X2 n=1 Tax=Phascolarctos cinereus TaxID=38626 RepID=A0A6P5JJX7_PHACI|nr:uncharacterized protein LOC110202664 isoform X2 [Phascolarctos cinereus]